MTVATLMEKRKETTINLRVSLQTRDLIDTAALATGKSRTEFVVDVARQHAIDVLLDQKLFDLDDAQFAEFQKVLDNPPKAPAQLRKLMSGKSPWEK